MTGEDIAVAAHEHASRRRRSGRALGLFERYLTVWVALCIVAGIALGHWFPAPFQAIGARRGRPGQPAGGGADLADDHPDAAEDRFRRAAPGEGALARHRRDAVHQLGGQAVLDGAARLAVHRLAVPAVAAGRPDRQLHRRADHPRRRALHGDGLRLVEPVRRRAALHAVARWRSTTPSWCSPSRRSWACCSGCRRSSCRGRRW